jgi:hypothetical protein
MSDWEALELARLTDDALQALLRNEVAAIRIPQFVDEEQRAAAADALLRCPAWAFYEGASPPLGRVGISQYEHHGSKDAYLAAAASASSQRATALAPLPDPLRGVLDAFADAWHGEVQVADEDGRAYFAGIFRRGGGGVKIHADWGPRDGPGWAIERIVAQLAWNLYYTSPAVGGELVVYDYPWAPHLEAHARQRFNDYDPTLFTYSRQVTMAPRPGEMIVFNSRNAHAVEASPDSDSRISFGSFVGATHDGDLIFWS